MDAGLRNDIPDDVRKMSLGVDIATVDSHCLPMTATTRILSVFWKLEFGRG